MKTALSGLVLTASTTYGLEASDVLVFSKGPVSLRPQASVYSEYNNNILFREHDVVDDFIQVFSPGIKILAGEDLPKANHFSLTYRLEQILYIDRSDLNATQHRLGFQGRYGSERTQIEGSDRLEFLSGTLGGGLDLNGSKVDRLVSSDLYRIDFRLGERSGIYGQIFHDATDFEDTVDLFDTQTLQGTAGFKWLFSADTDIFGELYYGETALKSNLGPADPPGKTYVGGYLGARGKFTEKLSGIVKAGVEYDQFDTPPGTANSIADSNLAPVVETDVMYTFTDRTSMALRYLRQQRVSVQFSRSAYVADEISVGASSILGSAGRLRLAVGGRLVFFDYEPSPSFQSRNDTIVGITTSASWYFQTWLWTRLQYEYSQYETDLAGADDYNQNRITISLEVGY